MLYVTALLYGTHKGLQTYNRRQKTGMFTNHYNIQHAVIQFRLRGDKEIIPQLRGIGNGNHKSFFTDLSSINIQHPLPRLKASEMFYNKAYVGFETPCIISFKCFGNECIETYACIADEVMIIGHANIQCVYLKLIDHLQCFFQFQRNTDRAGQTIARAFGYNT